MEQAIEEKIKQRRRQMLVHSYIYYRMDKNIVSDSKWAEWGKELQDLQEKYPIISSRVEYAEAFKDWDASTGAFLPLDEPWIKVVAERLLNGKKRNNKILLKQAGEKSSESGRRKTSSKQRSNNDEQRGLFDF